MSGAAQKKKTIDLSIKQYIIANVTGHDASPCGLSKELNLHRKAASNILCRAKKGHRFHVREGRPAAFDDQSMDAIRVKKADGGSLLEEEKVDILRYEYRMTRERNGYTNNTKDISRRTLKRYLDLLF